MQIFFYRDRNPRGEIVGKFAEPTKGGGVPVPPEVSNETLYWSEVLNFRSPV